MVAIRLPLRWQAQNPLHGCLPRHKPQDARDKRDEARKLLTQGVDPAEHRKTAQAARADSLANSFEVIAWEWFSKNQSSWSETHGDRILRRFERDIFPWIGKKPIADLTPPGLLSVVRRIESRGAVETAHRALQNCGQVIRYAVATGRAPRDITADLREALPPTQETHLAAVTEPAQVAPTVS